MVRFPSTDAPFTLITSTGFIPLKNHYLPTNQENLVHFNDNVIIEPVQNISIHYCANFLDDLKTCNCLIGDKHIRLIRNPIFKRSNISKNSVTLITYLNHTNLNVSDLSFLLSWRSGPVVIPFIIDFAKSHFLCSCI